MIRRIWRRIWRDCSIHTQSRTYTLHDVRPSPRRDVGYAACEVDVAWRRVCGASSFELHALQHDIRVLFGNGGPACYCIAKFVAAFCLFS